MPTEVRPGPRDSTIDQRTAARALVDRTCRAQGLPERVDDGRTLALVAAILLMAHRQTCAPPPGRSCGAVDALKIGSHCY